MRCVVIRDGNLEVQERETPEPGPNDVIVAVRGAGINAADLMQRDGHYPAPEGWPVDIPGMELAGVVSAVGERVHGQFRVENASAVRTWLRGIAALYDSHRE